MLDFKKKEKKEAMVGVPVRVLPEMRQQIRELASQHEASESEIVRWIIERYFDEMSTKSWQERKPIVSESKQA